MGAKGIDRINKLGTRGNDEGAIRERGKRMDGQEMRDMEVLHMMT